MGRYPLSTVINGKKYTVHIVRKQRKDFNCTICEEDLQVLQGYLFIDEPKSHKPAHLECARISSRSLHDFM